MNKYTCPLYAKGTCKKGNKCKMHHGPTSNELCLKINSFVTELKSIKHINFAGLNIEETICNFLGIIEKKPNFLHSYLECKKMPLYKPTEFSSYALLKDSFNSFMDYCLVLQTISYINNRNDFDTNNFDEFKEYMFKIYADKIRNCHRDNSVTDATIYINTKQYPYILGILPAIQSIISYHVYIVESLEEFIKTITRNYPYIETPAKKHNTHIGDISVDFTKYPASEFTTQENMEKIIMYPYISDVKWFYSIVNFPEGNTMERMHKYIMNIKSEIKYNENNYRMEKDFYAFVSKNNISKKQQEKILELEHDSVYVNNFGNYFGSHNYLTIGELFKITFGHNTTIATKIDMAILNNKIINLNDYNIKTLLENNSILQHKMDWFCDKLQNTDYSNMNIIDAIKYYKDQLQTVDPIIVKKSFCSLDLNMNEYVTILKKFIEMENTHLVCVDNDNNIVISGRKMIGINEEIPKYIHIEFDMPYCLLCKEIHVAPKITTRFKSIKKEYKNVTQPHICSNCFDMIDMIRSHPSTNKSISNEINYNENIMELTLIDKKMSLIIFGFKYDDKTILNTLVMDILKIIIILYVKSINFQ